MTGYAALTRKELWESVRTYRLLIACVVFLLVGLSGPLLAYYLPDIIRSSAKTNIHITVGKQTAVDAVTSYLGSATQIPMFALILLTMGTIAEERSRGIAAMVLYRPVNRAAYLLSKVTVYGLVAAVAVALGAAAAFYYTAVLFPGASLGPFVLINIGLLLMALDVVALTVLCSAMFPSNIAAGGAAFVLFILYSSLPPLWPPLGDSLPTAIVGHARDLMSGAWTAEDVIRPAVGGLIVAALAIIAAYLRLRRLEA